MKDFYPAQGEEFSIFGGLYRVSAAGLGQLFRRFDVFRVREGTTYEKFSAELLLLIAALYVLSLFGTPPLEIALVSLIPDFLQLAAIRHFLFVRRVRLGKYLVWIGAAIDIGLTIVFFLEPSLALFDKGLACLQSLGWVTLLLISAQIDQQLVRQ